MMFVGNILLPYQLLMTIGFCYYTHCKYFFYFIRFDCFPSFVFISTNPCLAKGWGNMITNALNHAE